MRQRIARHKAAVAPSVDADSRTIDARLSFQPRQAVFNILELQRAEIPVKRPDRFGSLAACRAVVADPDDDAFLREALVIHPLGAAPRISHRLRMRSAVGELIHGITA